MDNLIGSVRQLSSICFSLLQIQWEHTHSHTINLVINVRSLYFISNQKNYGNNLLRYAFIVSPQQNEQNVQFFVCLCVWVFIIWKAREKKTWTNKIYYKNFFVNPIMTDALFQHWTLKEFWIYNNEKPK